MEPAEQNSKSAALPQHSRFKVPDPPIPSLSGFRPPCLNPGSDSEPITSVSSATSVVNIPVESVSSVQSVDEKAFVSKVYPVRAGMSLW